MLEFLVNVENSFIDTHQYLDTFNYVLMNE